MLIGNLTYQPHLRSEVPFGNVRSLQAGGASCL